MRRMHAAELDIDVELVRALLRRQMPRWADLPLRRIASSGTDNAIFRLSEEMAVRLPRIYWAAAQPRLEATLLPWLAPQLSLPTSMPLALGDPDLGYPYHWLVYEWLPGVDAFSEPPSDMAQVARDLASYIHSLRSADWTNLPEAARPFIKTYATVRELDARIQVALDEVAELTDAPLARKAWDEALAVPEWQGAPIFTHGDLHAPNLLVTGGRVTAIIDFGSSGFGDPARELIGAWTMFDEASRSIFRQELAERGLIDDDMWNRARVYALSKALFALPYYVETNPTLLAIARHTLGQVFSET